MLTFRTLEVHSNGNGALPTALIKGQWKVTKLYWEDGSIIEV
jgi:hypothetical protein